LRSLLDEAGCKDHCPDCKISFRVPGSTNKAKVRARFLKKTQDRQKKKEKYRQELQEKQEKNRQQRAEAFNKAKAFVGDAVKDTVNRAFRDTEEAQLITIIDKIIIGRSAEKANWVVTDQQVAETHCGVFLQGDVLSLIDLGSSLGTILNGEKIQANDVLELHDDDVFRVGPDKFIVEGQSLRAISYGDHAHLVCRGLCRDVASANGGGKIRILSEVDLDIEPGDFVVLLGPSGSGKSTLLNALSGRALATHGEVLLNQEDLYDNFDRLKTRLATVPQKDLLHTQLTLSSSLRYIADLRLPSDMTTSEKNRRVKRVIREVEMEEHASSEIANYSGGQLKRASLANELLADPSLLFVDEATSGLDEHSDQEIMAMMRQLADAGKTVVCITHNLGNVPEYVQKLVVMAEGGYVAFVGSPAETLRYFLIGSLSDLYLRLKEKPGNIWAKQFNDDRRSKGGTGLQKSGERRIDARRQPPSPVRRFKTVGRHCYVSFLRTAELQLKDGKSLAVAIAQPIFVFMLIWIVIGTISDDPGPANQKQIANGLSVIFLIGISAFWFGCSNSAKEIVKERELFERERNAGLSPIGYLVSKAMFLFSLTMLQSWFLLIAVKIATDLDGSLILYGISVTAIALCGVALGLAISVLSANTDIASTAVPLAIIPQVILAGMLKRLEGFSESVAWLVAPSYWCFGSMSHVWHELWDESLNTDGMVSQHSFGLSIFTLGLFTIFFFLICCISLSGIGIPYLRSRK
jgi:ABC-type multidrug transport system ATPase subunit